MDAPINFDSSFSFRSSHISSIHEEQDCFQTIKAAEVVNVTNNMHYILNLNFNRQQNYFLTGNAEDIIGPIRSIFSGQGGVDITKNNRS